MGCIDDIDLPQVRSLPDRHILELVNRWSSVHPDCFCEQIDLHEAGIALTKFNFRLKIIFPRILPSIEIQRVNAYGLVVALDRSVPSFQRVGHSDVGRFGSSVLSLDPFPL